MRRSYLEGLNVEDILLIIDSCLFEDGIQSRTVADDTELLLWVDRCGQVELKVGGDHTGGLVLRHQLLTHLGA